MSPMDEDSTERTETEDINNLNTSNKDDIIVDNIKNEDDLVILPEISNDIHKSKSDIACQSYTDQNDPKLGLIDNINNANLLQKDEQESKKEPNELPKKILPIISHKTKFSSLETIEFSISTPFSSLIHLRDVPIDTSIFDIKVALGNDTDQSYDFFNINLNQKILKDGITFRQLIKKVEFPLTFDLTFSKPDADHIRIKLGTRVVAVNNTQSLSFYVVRHILAQARPGKEDVLEVLHKNADGTEVKIRVTIVWVSPDLNKPYLGGYRHKLSGIVYHNALVQTIPKPKPPPEVPHFSRDSQTYKMRHFGQNTVNMMSTQMTKPGYYVSNIEDKLLTPGPYETADEYHARILKNIIVIQKYYRRWLATRKVNALRKQRDLVYAYEEAQRKNAEAERAARLEYELDRRLHPRTRADFDKLYNALEKWRMEETEKIYHTYSLSAERKAALALLMDQVGL